MVYKEQELGNNQPLDWGGNVSRNGNHCLCSSWGHFYCLDPSLDLFLLLRELRLFCALLRQEALKISPSSIMTF
ncbi:hypothetical protein J6590_084180, partial [Homalodisca vitripennis]